MKGSFTDGDKSNLVEIEISPDMDTPSSPEQDASNRSDIPITIPSKNCNFRPLHLQKAISTTRAALEITQLEHSD